MKKITYLQLSSFFIPELISFVLTENELHHGKGNVFTEMEAEKAALCDEEAQYHNSHIFAAMFQKRICGSIRIFKRKAFQQLPTEKLYPVDLTAITEAGQPVYHIGRFAIAKGCDEKSFRIFKTLMALALNVADKEPTGTVFAECDLKLLRTIRLLGIEAEAIGEPMLYLGSETVPVQLPWAGYQTFLNRYRNLPGYKVPFLRQEFSDLNLSP
ncbi:hypothetical protein KSK37_12230 [Kaistella sp. DKR-2]|uniref:N-acyl amino acid synthase FeeM domain-containing protein n=1 Tax=Kaistella soli TaxID=2849654 RepID=UPI001C27DCF4|nr:hypothetical protein [Kaistella soli]MBU8883854.1 hypothetical protein [Kaistella soli]